MTNERINVLLIDSHSAEASRIRVFLENNPHQECRVFHFNSWAATVQAMRAGDIGVFDVIVLDLFLVDPFSPKETYQAVQREAEDKPIIVMTEKKARQQAMEIVANGASDIIVRERFETYPNRLLDAIEFSLIRQKLHREMKEKHADEVRHHKQMLHWMTGGYSIEAEVDLEDPLPREQLPSTPSTLSNGS